MSFLSPIFVKSRSLEQLRRPAVALVAIALFTGTFTAMRPFAFAAPSTTMAVATPTPFLSGLDTRSDVSRWSDSIWSAAKSGDFAAVEAGLKEVPESQAHAESKRLRDSIAARAEHLSEDTLVREAGRAEALAELKTAFDKDEVTKALTAAVKLQTLSDDWTAALALPEIAALVTRAEAFETVAQDAGDWLVAQEILIRLRTLYEESGNAAALRGYDEKLDEVNKRIGLLAQYAPHEFWALREAYAKRFDPTKPFPAFNEAFAGDWKESLDGISRGMLTAALTIAANKHVSCGGWEPLVSGGLDAVRVLATTPTLKENFAGLVDAEKTAAFVEAIEKSRALLASMDRAAVGKPQYLAALRDVLAANAVGPQFPDTAIYREFGDGALEELSQRFEDDYTQIIWPDQVRRFQQMIKGDFVGVGINIRHDDRRDIQVLNPLEGSPASRSGVKSDDRIIAVDGKSTVGWTLNKAVDSITGPAGKPVVLSVRREGVESPIDLELIREQIKIRSVNGWWKKALDERGAPVWDWYIAPEAGIGYLRLTSFNDDSFDDFMIAVRQMRKERTLNGLILDLRHNPGGLLTSAVQFSNVFIENGKIVAGQDREHRQVWEMMAEPQRAFLKDLPLVVLVNQGSASASEIVSGALKAHDRAVVLGERSFGKGSVQSVEDCSDQRAGAQIKLTTNYYLLPPGPGETEMRLVHKRPGSTDWGVLPDLVVNMTPQQIEESVVLRQTADVIEEWKDKADQKVRPDVQDLLSKGIDPQLELALLLLEARGLKSVDAAAQAAATDSTTRPSGG